MKKLIAGSREVTGEVLGCGRSAGVSGKDLYTLYVVALRVPPMHTLSNKNFTIGIQAPLFQEDPK